MRSKRSPEPGRTRAEGRRGRDRAAFGEAEGGNPPRAALLSAEQMRRHGSVLAGLHEVSPRRLAADRFLTARLSDNEAVLLKVRGILSAAVAAGHAIAPAGDWLLDNFYLIEEQARMARKHLPRGYDRELPRLRTGPSAGLPRVYDIALENISHGDCRVDAENLGGFVEAYQSVHPLTLGELWAIPIMLRLALVENLRGVASRIASDMAEKERAGIWADRMTETAARDPGGLILAIAEMVLSAPPMTRPFVAELARRLQGRGSELALPLTWIEQRLSESGSTIKRLVEAEIRQLASDQVSIGNGIGSLRALGSIDWHEFVEGVSVVERVLGGDPSGHYRSMDFATRDAYRHAIEAVARGGGRSEEETAGLAVGLAAEAAAGGAGERAAHVGYWLIDAGRPRLERLAGVRGTPRRLLARLGRRFPLALYSGSIGLAAAIPAAGLVLAARGGIGGAAGLAAFALLAALCSTRLAFELVNRAVTLLVRPRPLPRLDFSRGIPPEARTIVVVPAMLADEKGAEEMAEALEVRFLANRDANLRFALLTDFLDADRGETPRDAGLLARARGLVEELNDRYREAGGDRFFLFHRPRLWNPRERLWMGRERKRGKLADLNAWLRGSRGGFSLVVGDTAALAGVRYVITLDEDTRLPRDSARQFAAAMAHPLNRARYDGERGRVVEGYGVIQPRVEMILRGASLSRYARLRGSEAGIDPYTRAVSDVYQDLFREGSYVGKGIYDVDAFEDALKDRLPDNLVLSHDLLEGSHARAGLLSDVHLLEEYPARYGTDVNRRRRWIRGDWQIARWVLPRVPVPGGGTRRNPLSGLSRWKILDNLRRSLVPPALLALPLIGWILAGPAWFWTLAAVALTCAAPAAVSLFDAARKPEDATWGRHLPEVLSGAARRLADALFTLACTPYEAWYGLQEAGRGLWRTLVSRRRLLEWNSAADAARNRRTGLAGHYLTMWAAPAAAAGSAILLLALRPGALPAALPLLGAWLAAPAIAWRLSQPVADRGRRLPAEKEDYLRRLARRTWSFFETFVGPEDNWLPPDNFQEDPVPVVAHRTSPTNIGLSLLATLAARDFGFIPADECLARVGRAFDAMDRLERRHGHFYNWYDTRSLAPLAPRYVSTVDSGNLAAYLLVLRAGLLAMPDEAVAGPATLAGLRAGFLVLTAAAEAAAPLSHAALRAELESAAAAGPEPLAAARARLARLSAAATALADALAGRPDDARGPARDLARQCAAALGDLDSLAPAGILADGAWPGAVPTLRELARGAAAGGGPEAAEAAEAARSGAASRIEAIEALARRCEGFADMEYDFLYDKSRRLFSIGYDADEGRKDPSFYDLLASEARLCCFVAIAQGKVPQESWFALGRQLTMAGGRPVLLSWSGSMFEYLMPLLVTPAFGESLLDQTCRSAVARQIEYGRQRGVPWGISESGYFLTDAARNYQYRAFGVPGLGLKRGLADDLVVAPYASALALMVAPVEACANLERLEAEGLAGRYGMYEAVDYTPARMPPGETRAVVASYMAHHEGMSFLALAQVLLDHPMLRRFRAEPRFMATALLLQERIPRDRALYSHTTELPEALVPRSGRDTPARIIERTDTGAPEVQLLSNGRYSVMVTDSGGGYSRWKDLALTRWREDGTRDDRGAFCYVRDLASGDFWSTTWQPTRKRPGLYEAIFSEGRAEFRRSDGDLDCHVSIVVSPEDDIELRRTRITNRGRTRREIDVTGYAEVVLERQDADLQHAAYGKLFVGTELDRGRHAILCRRRPRSPGEPTPWFLHLVTAYGEGIGEASYETDRARFVGRWNDASSPAAMRDPGPLSGSEGSTLDPVVAVRYAISLGSEESVTIDTVSGVGADRAAAMALVDKYQDRRSSDRVFDLAWTQSQVLLRQLNATEADAQLYCRLAGAVIHARSTMRADPSLVARNRRGQSGLWGYSISGDLPIVLLQIESAENIELARRMIQAHEYWRLKGLAVDLVIWNEDQAGYRQLLHDRIIGLLASGAENGVLDRPGGIFLRASDQISVEDRVLIQTAARVIIGDGRGGLAEQVKRRVPPRKVPPRLVPSRNPTRNPARGARPGSPEPATRDRPDLLFFNGLGGFTPDGREYIVSIDGKGPPPAPWSNVIANPEFGTVVSEGGMAYTWGENAHEFRLTPWDNDPVCDSGGEAVYVRDEERGHWWSPMPLPARGGAPYLTRHGFGYSVFEHVERGIETEVWVYVAVDASVKFTVVKCRNVSGRPRRISVTGYVEWVLGDLRQRTAMHVVTELDPSGGSIQARNAFGTDMPGRVAFFAADDGPRSHTGDREEFLGRGGSLRDPAAMSRTGLSGRLGATLDPCAALMLPFDLAPGQSREVIFTLGLGKGADEAARLAARFRGPAAARGALEEVWRHWNRSLGAARVETPDPALNVMANRWLLYQTLACRMWARSGYYQSGGAFGFRDQLQDSMAILHAEPGLAREHLLRAASRQFPEGDVQHWWHPPSGRGVRTRCSDDFLWLPAAVARYVLVTGDSGVLDEQVPFIEGREPREGEESLFELPGRSAGTDSLYGHCVLALARGESRGGHGLPLIGSGDWNDGMNTVGAEGRGESVWLGFFLHDTLRAFADLAESRGDGSFAERCRAGAERLRVALEREGWDGGWYRRAYFDDGSPLGSAANDECSIDSIPQSWSVLSGAGDPGRASAAMEALDELLVRRDASLVLLLNPPLDASALEPGYIKGYVPGVRENGGQYTHAAVWAAMAFAAMGDTERAWELASMINPVNHALDPKGVDAYRVEPYVMAADVYALPPHVGRGGWTWYTGSAGWMYRLLLESILGLRVEGARLRVEPCFPDSWDSYAIDYRYRETRYRVSVLRAEPGGAGSLSLDGAPVAAGWIDLVDDRRGHEVLARIPAARKPPGGGA